MTETFYLIQFDNELMFHNDRKMYISAVFNGFESKYDAARKLLSNIKLVKEIFFYDDKENNYPSRFMFRSSIDNYDKKLLDNDINYYHKHPEQFCEDLLNSDNLDGFI